VSAEKDGRQAEERGRRGREGREWRGGSREGVEER